MPDSLAAALQQLTGQLAAAQTTAEVLGLALTPAMTALGALAGTVLLLDASAAQLLLAAARGQREQTLWQAGPLLPGTPPGDVLLGGQALYFEQAGSLLAAYPALEVQTGGRAAVASALVPITDDHALGVSTLGVLVLDFREPHPFTPDERRFLFILGTQIALGLQRARLLDRLREQVAGNPAQVQLVRTLTAERGQLQQDVRRGAADLLAEQAATRAFVQFVQDSADAETVNQLTERATQVLRTVVGDVSLAYYELREGRWTVRAHSEDISASFLAQMRAGHSQDTPRFAGAVAAHGAHFTDGWNPDAEQLPTDQRYSASATYAYFWEDTPVGMLSLACREKAAWAGADREAVRAVGRALGLLLERIRALEVQQRSNADLMAANAELEAFTYSASHDLRTPVRHVQSFVDLLEQSLEQPSEKTRRYLGVIRAAGTRMNTLIDAMLLLSRAGRVPLHSGPVSLSHLVSQAQQDAELEFPGVRVDWQIGAMPELTGDQDTLQQVMTNLLSNAVKYRSGSGAVVEVWGEARPREVRVFVRDHGVGFDMQYAPKLFGVFQRLHRAEDYPGTGAGLATVRRIVQRHGGQVFAEGTPGQGATFGFWLPEARGSAD